MVLTLLDAKMEVYDVGADDPSTDDPAHVFYARDMNADEETKFDITQRVQAGKDNASFHFDNSDGQFSGVISSGEKIVFESYHGAGADITPAEYGTYRHGEATYGGATDTPVRRKWHGYAHGPTYKHYGQGRVGATFEASDFVSEVCATRIVYAAYEETQIAGTENSIVNELLANYAPEIHRDQIDTITQQTSVEFNGVPLLEALEELAEIANAVMYSEDDSLVFTPLVNVTPDFELGYDDIYLAELESDDRELYNDVRVDGATSYGLDEFTAENDADIVNYYTVTENDRLFYRLNPEKPKLDRISVWIRAKDNTDDFRVRIQRANADDTGPRSPDNQDRDIVSNTSAADFLPNDGWRRGFRFADEPLPERPWLIIEAAGEEGHDVGITSNNDPAIQTFYPYPIFVNHQDGDSVDEYRRRQHRRKKDSITSFTEADDAARSLLTHHNRPDRTLEFEAASLRAHLLEVGDAITVNMPELTAVSGEPAPEFPEDEEATTTRLDSFEDNGISDRYTGHTGLFTPDHDHHSHEALALHFDNSGQGTGTRAIYSHPDNSHDPLPAYPHPDDSVVWDLWLDRPVLDDASGTQAAATFLFGGPDADNCYGIDVDPDGVWIYARVNGDRIGLEWTTFPGTDHLETWTEHAVRWRYDAEADEVRIQYRMYEPDDDADGIGGEELLSTTATDPRARHTGASGPGGIGFGTNDATSAWVDNLRLFEWEDVGTATEPDPYIIVERSDDFDTETNKLYTTFTAREFDSI